MSDAGAPQRRTTSATTESAAARAALIAFALAFLALFLILPVAVVFAEALRKGVSAYLATFDDPDARAAIALTLTVVAIAVPLNMLFGIAASWAIAKFEFRGKNLLITLIDLPFSISPVVSGLIYVLLFGAQGYFGPWLKQHGIEVIFALPGIVLATIFVTFPFVARELIPLMEQQGSTDEEAALTLGASGLRAFLTVTLPNIRWGLLYGVALTTARSIGEIGAVLIVSGLIKGKTETATLFIFTAIEERQTTEAYIVAITLAAVSIVLLVTIEASRRRIEGRKVRT